MSDEEKVISISQEDAERIAEEVLNRAVRKADEAIGAGFRGWVFKVVLMALVFVLGVAASKGLKP